MKLNEMEIKIQIDSDEDFQRIFNACNELCGPPVSHVLQLDEYYDTPDGQLRNQDLVIRIRSTGEGRTIALKSPRVMLPSGISNRIELEFRGAEDENVTEQLKNQGLNPHESSEKERWTFNYKNCEIALDKLPFIGSFIEIEGPSELEIQETARVVKPFCKSCGPAALRGVNESKVPRAAITHFLHLRHLCKRD